MNGQRPHYNDFLRIQLCIIPAQFNDFARIFATRKFGYMKIIDFRITFLAGAVLIGSLTGLQQ
jgi:hypothetical protein